MKSGYILPFKKMGNGYSSYRGGVVDTNGVFIEESIMSFGPLFGGSYAFDRDKIKDHKKKIVFCGMISLIWGHFLTDSLSRMWFLYHKQCDKDIKFAWLVDEKNINSIDDLPQNFIEILNLLGCDNTNVILINSTDLPLFSEEILIPEKAFIANEYLLDEFIFMYKKICEQAKLEKLPIYEKIFLSKKHWLGESIYVREMGYNKIENFFENNGFTLISPENISVRELIWYLQHCKVAAACEGSIAHNFIFCNKDTKVLIARRSNIINKYQILIDNAIGYSCTWIDSFPPKYPLVNPNPGGPFVMGVFPMLQKFAADNNMHIKKEACFNLLKNYIFFLKMTLGVRLKNSRNPLAQYCYRVWKAVKSICKSPKKD